MLQTTYETIWFFLPAIIANMLPVFAARFNWLPLLNRPLDAGLCWHHHRILGDHKTVRGLVVGVVGGGVTGTLQYLLSLIGLMQVNNILVFHTLGEGFLYGSLIGFGAIFGDALKSFFKRRFHMPSGSSWKPWDQIDLVIGVVIVTSWWAHLTFLNVVIAFVMIGFGSYVVSFIGAVLGIKKSV